MHVTKLNEHKNNCDTIKYYVEHLKYFCVRDYKIVNNTIFLLIHLRLLLFTLLLPKLRTKATVKTKKRRAELTYELRQYKLMKKLYFD